ncbi:MAG: ribosomal protein S18-alanine N-acetyltransferase [Pseudomonadota bacterium]
MVRADVESVSRIEYEQPIWTTRQFEEELEQPSGRQLVACTADSQEIVGYFCCRIMADEAEIIKIAVERKFRQQGIASLLMEAGLEQMKSSGVRECFLEVRKSNFQALFLYRKYFFCQVGVRRDYYSSPIEDALIFKLTTGGAL